MQASALAVTFATISPAVGATADDSAPPTAQALAKEAAQRYPQPVRVGDLLHRDVLKPVESQDILGTVQQVVRAPDGTIEVVVEYGGFLGLGGRPIAVPINAMVLVGKVMEIVDFTPAQLNKFPNFQPAGTTPLGKDTTIQVGLAKPSH